MEKGCPASGFSTFAHFQESKQPHGASWSTSYGLIDFYYENEIGNAHSTSYTYLKKLLTMFQSWLQFIIQETEFVFYA